MATKVIVLKTEPPAPVYEVYLGVESGPLQGKQDLPAYWWRNVLGISSYNYRGIASQAMALRMANAVAEAFDLEIAFMETQVVKEVKQIASANMAIETVDYFDRSDECHS